MYETAYFSLFHLAGFEKRRCEANSAWKPEVPACRETLCPPLGEIEHGAMHLTTLRIGGRATYKCDYGFGLKVREREGSEGAAIYDMCGMICKV